MTQGSATLSYTTPAYVSMDQPRAVTLFYASGQAAPYAFVQVDATDPGAPLTYSIRIKDAAGSWLTAEQFQTAAPGTNRLAVQWDVSASPTAVASYPVTIVVRSYYSGGTFAESTLGSRVLAVNERNSPYGKGWSLAGVQRLTIQSDGVVVTDGAGGAVFYLKSGSSYLKPDGVFDELTFDGTRYHLTAPDASEAVFTSTGRLEKVQDRFANATVFGYNTNALIDSITDPAGKVITLGYNGSNKLASITDPASRTATITYSADSQNEYLAVSDSAGTTALVAAQALGTGRLVSYNDRAGSTWNVTYDAVGTVASIAAPQVNTSDAGLARPTVQFVSLRKAVLPATGTGTQGSPAAAVRSDSVRVRATDPRGNTTRAQVDRYGLPLRIEEPLGRVTTIERDVHGRVTRTIAPSGHAVKQTWTGVDLTQVVDESTGDTVNTAYDATYHQPTHVWGDATTETWNYYGTLGVLDSTRTGTSTSPVSKFTYDGRGRVKSATDGEGDGSYYTYADELAGSDTSTKNLKWVAVGAQETSYRRTTMLWFDLAGRDTMSVSPDNDTTRTRYNRLNWVTRVVDARAGNSVYQYTALGQVYVFTDPKGQSYTFNRNALGWVTSEVDPNLYVATYQYDRSGNPTVIVPRRGSTYQVTVAYDSLNRVWTRTADGQTATFSYASDDRWMKGSNAASTDSVAVDVAGRPTTILTRRGSNTYVQTPTYDSRGLLSQLSVTGPWSGAHTTGYHFDAKMQLDTLTDFGGQKTSIEYNGDGMETMRHLPVPSAAVGREYTSVHVPYSVSTYTGWMEDLRVEYNLNANGLVGARISRYSLLGGETGQLVRSYRYDRVGRITRSEERKYPDSSNIGCDPGTPATRDVGGCVPMGAGQVVSFAKTFSWDSVGNPRHDGAVVGTGNRLTSFNGYTLEYDTDGNLTRKAKTGWEQTFVWNSLGQLASTTVNGSTVYFSYDAFGRWIKRDQPGVSTIEYVYQGDDLHLERDASGNVTEYTYLPGIDQPHSMRRSGKTYYYQTDVPGSVLAVLNDSGRVVNRYSYDAWGQTLNNVYNPTVEGMANSLKFAARQYEPTSKLYQMRARWYDPELQRFVSEDPVGLEGGLNPYSYAENNPVNFTDPFGLCTEQEVVVYHYFNMAPFVEVEHTGLILAWGCHGGGANRVGKPCKRVVRGGDCVTRLPNKNEWEMIGRRIVQITNPSEDCAGIRTEVEKLYSKGQQSQGFLVWEGDWWDTHGKTRILQEGTRGRFGIMLSHDYLMGNPRRHIDIDRYLVVHEGAHQYANNANLDRATHNDSSGWPYRMQIECTR